MDHVIIDDETRVWMHNDRLSDDSSSGLKLTFTQSVQALTESTSELMAVDPAAMIHRDKNNIGDVCRLSVRWGTQRALP